MVLLNQSRVSTFVEDQKESIVDLTWAFPAVLHKVRG